jgi:hypothetical protein
MFANNKRKNINALITRVEENGCLKTILSIYIPYSSHELDGVAKTELMRAYRIPNMHTEAGWFFVYLF